MKLKKVWISLLSAVLLLAALPAAAYGEEETGQDKTSAPYFFVQSAAGDTDSFPLKATDVSTNINGVIAETYVTQTYANEGKTPINASYVFPASTRVTVHGMTMEIGDQLITTQIKEKEKAREEFTQAKKEGESASLLEEQRPNVFTMNVANIMPGDTVRIKLHYTELIVSTEGVYQFVFPTVVGPRYSGASGEQAEAAQWTAAPYIKDGGTPPGTCHITVGITSGVPIKDLTCKSHKINVTKDGENQATVTLADPRDYAGNRDFILDYRLTSQDVSCGLMLNQDTDENFFMLMVQPPERYKPENVLPRDYIFVLDVSGSMFGYPLDTAKELIKNLVGNLRETDTFNVVLFSGGSAQLSETSLPANAENIQAAIDFMDNEDGGGGTELAPALRKAITLPRDQKVSRSIVVITDGYISRETEIFDMIRRNLNSTSFFSFGIGDSVNRSLIDGIARAGQGEAFVVTDSADAMETAQRFRTYIEAPILTDIHVTYDGFEAYDVEPKILPTLFAQRPIILLGKWKGEPAGSIRVEGKMGDKPYIQDIPVSGVQPLAANDAIRYLWARDRVARLTDYGGGEIEGSRFKVNRIRHEVTELGLKYSMVTPYTSFLAVLDMVRNKEGGSQDVSQPLPLPQNVSNLAVGGYTTGSEPGSPLLIPMIAAVLGTGALDRRRRRRRGETDDME